MLVDVGDMLSQSETIQKMCATLILSIFSLLQKNHNIGGK